MKRYACLAALLVVPVAWAGWPDEAFVNRVPAAANAVLAADVAAVFRSPLAQREGWARRFQETRQATLGSLPPAVETILVAGQFNFSRLTPLWLLALQDSSRLITLADIARAEGSNLGQVGGQVAVTSQRDAIFASLGQRQLAVYSPADRQAFARWLRGGAAGPSAYLRKAVAEPAGAQVVIAFDLADAVNGDAARALLVNLPAGATSRLSAPLLGNVFASVEGFTLRVSVNEAMTGRLQINFATAVGSVGPHVAGLVRDLLAHVGADIDDLKDWKPTVAERSVELEGPLSPAGLLQAVSLFELPGTASVSPGERTAGGAPTGPATLEYFRALTAILNDVRRWNPNLNAERTFNRFAHWHETAAGRIDDLPTFQVDPGLLEFGAWAASTLRAIGVSLRGVPIKTQQAGAGAFAFTNGATAWNPWWGFSNWNVDTNLPEVWANQAQTVANDAKARLDAWKQIDDGLAEKRRLLSDKYRLAF